MSPTTVEPRELAARESDGIHVLLLWHRAGTLSPSRSRTPASETASASRSRPATPSTPSTTRSPTRREPQGGTRNVKPDTDHSVAQHRSPHGPLERRPLEDRDLRLARVRRRRLRPRRHGRHEVDRSRQARTGRVGSDGQDSRRGLQAARQRERPHSERDAQGQRSCLHRGDRGRTRGHLEDRDVQNVRSPLEAGANRQISQTGTQPLSSSRSAGDPTTPATRSTRSSTGSTSSSLPTRSSSSASSATPARSTRS